MTIMIHGFEITTDANNSYVKLAKHDRAQNAWGAKAAKAIRKIEKLKSNDAELHSYLTQTLCNGF